MGRRRGLGEVKEAAAANEEPFACSSALSAGGEGWWVACLVALSVVVWWDGVVGRRTAAQRTAFRLVFISEGV